MNATVISKENNVVKFTYVAEAEVFEKGIQYAYNKNKNSISVPGFRKGKVPRKIIERQYGVEIFYDDAINFALNETYAQAIDELSLDVVSRPNVDVKDIDREKGISFEVEVTVKPPVELGQYKGLEYTLEKVEVTDDDVMAVIDNEREMNSRMIEVTDRPAQMGDTANISYLGTVNGVPFDGGKDDNYNLLLGSHTFIDTFEDQIVGHNIGDKFDVNVTFPTGYHADNLAGKPAVFAVELKGLSIKELPEVNDEFAQDVSDFDTLDEYKANIVEKIKEEKEANVKKAKINSLLEKATDNAKVDIPDCMIEDRLDSMMDEIKANLDRQGVSLDMYCTITNTTPDKMRESSKPMAERNVKERLVLEQIIKEENIQVTDEDIEKEVEKIATMYNIPVDKFKEVILNGDKTQITEDIKFTKAIDIIEDSAVEAK